MLRRLLLWFLTIVCCLVFTWFGLWLYVEYRSIEQELPRLSAMQNYRPSLTSLVYSDDDKVIGEFAFEDRELVSIAEVPQRLQQAVLATEDTDFYQHNGVNFKAIIRAFRANLHAGKISQGGSTITQQVARELFLSKEKSWLRKIKEAIIALELEARFTKSQIFELYLNQIYFGHGAYGVRSAARRFFAKSLNELTVAECALLAGMPQAPSSTSPFTSLDRAMSRRHTVIMRMLDAGFISDEQARGADEEPIILKSGSRVEFEAPYFLEYVRRTMEDLLTTNTVHAGGLKIYTALNANLQKAAEAAVFWGLHELTKRQGYDRTKVPDDVPISTIRDKGVVLKLPIKRVAKDTLEVEFDGATAIVNPAKDGWRVPGGLVSTFTEGDRALFVIAADKEHKGNYLQLYQFPSAQAALVSMQTGTGYILSWVGGSDFEKSKFDRVVQARRQPGSGFKPIIYTAALDTKFTAADIIYDSPIVTEMASSPTLEKDEFDQVINEGRQDLETSGYRSEGKDEKAYWKPGNYEEHFLGPTTLRVGLEKSRNLVAIKLLSLVGVSTAIQYARLLGIESPLGENLSLALGSSGVIPLEFLGAYGVFADQGHWIKPIAIKRVLDRDDHVIFENLPETRTALLPATAFAAVNLLRGVVEHGTGAAASALGRPLAGKTGTTNDFRDAWFTGFSRQVVTTTWVGFDEPRRLGNKETGARVALPIWMSYMEVAHKGQAVLDFVKPSGIVSVNIDAETGLVATNKCTKVISESFLEGTEPVRLCDRHSADRTQFLRFDAGYDSKQSEPEEAESPFSYPTD